VLQANHPTIGDVRGRGLMIGVEIVQDRARRIGFQGENRTRMRKIVNDHLDSERILASVTAQVGDVLPLVPPLVITRNEVDRILGAIDRSLAKLESEFDISA
jgi:4-aminobutyrate aminotransferase-like enzyme